MFWHLYIHFIYLFIHFISQNVCIYYRGISSVYDVLSSLVQNAYSIDRLILFWGWVVFIHVIVGVKNCCQVTSSISLQFMFEIRQCLSLKLGLSDWFGKADWPMNFGYSPFSAFPTSTHWELCFSVGAEDLNSGLHSCATVN